MYRGLWRSQVNHSTGPGLSHKEGKMEILLFPFIPVWLGMKALHFLFEFLFGDKQDNISQ